MMRENISKFISNDISRCDNYKCERRNRCARHQQLIADIIENFRAKLGRALLKSVKNKVYEEYNQKERIKR